MADLEFTEPQTEDEALVQYLEERATGDEVTWEEFLVLAGDSDDDEDD